MTSFFVNVFNDYYKSAFKILTNGGELFFGLISSSVTASKSVSFNPINLK